MNLKSELKSEDLIKLPVTLVVLQECILTELNNAIDMANESQDAFSFILYPETIRFDSEKYKFSSGAYNLIDAAHDLVQRRRSLKKLVSGNLVFITSYPDSDSSLYREFKGKSVTEELSQCFFLEREDYPFGSIRLISTYIWEQLPLPEHFLLPKSPSGRRSLQPYLLFMFASVALDLLVDVPYHDETHGCPFDYCNNVREIDRAFQSRNICNEHDQFLKAKVRNNALSKDQYFSFMGLLNRAFGRPSKFKWDVVISFAGPQRDIAKKLADAFINEGYTPFYDDYRPSELVGEDLTTYLYDVYSKSSRYCIIIISEDYKYSMWTNLERRAAQSRAVRDRGAAYILPISVDGARLDGFVEDLAYLDFNKLGFDKISKILIEKLDP